jgi:hypothetical protein
MGLDTHQRQQARFFTGYEVEHTVCFGMKTLFVVGVQPIDNILALARAEDVKMIYFGTSQSFNPTSISHEQYNPWDVMIYGCLEQGYWVTLDFDVQHVEGVLESGYNENPKFVSMISCKIPYINQFNYNTTLKLDDSTWGATNPGVWTHQLHDLMSKNTYTHWDQYTQDTKVNFEHDN